MTFPSTRLRRLRGSSNMRRLVKETSLHVDQLIYPLFVTTGSQVKEEIPSMPGVYHVSLDLLAQEMKELQQLKIPAVLLFGVPDTKDDVGSSAFAENGIVQKAVREIKRLAPEMLVITDTCLCQFTSHGHCGVIVKNVHTGDSVIDNDSSLKYLVKTAISQAEAGADVIAPSNMMDGFVLAIRTGLDESGYSHIPIMSYAVKYASAFYGPFRDAAHSTPQFGDRKTYQMDPANRNEAIREAECDVTEGADFLIVKPALAYMDIIRDVSDRFQVPVVAYNVSAEYSMVKAASLQGWIEEKEVVLESLIGMRRAGAQMIITYFAKQVATWLQECETRL